MNILGISGLGESRPYKRRIFPHLEERLYHMTQGNDAAAALVGREGVLAAAAEERFSREKGTGAFPRRAIEAVLAQAGLDDFDVIAHGFDYEPLKKYFDRDDFGRKRFDAVYARAVLERAIDDAFPGRGWSKKLVPVPHHLAHAASTFEPSGFDDALVLIADSVGEMHSTTVLTASRANGYQVLGQVGVPHSLGLMYGAFTQYLGFWMGMDEYKVMGLAPYGDPERFYAAVRKLVLLKSDGSFAIPLLNKNKSPEDWETNAGIMRELTALFGPPRAQESELRQEHMDLAAALQRVLQEALLAILRHHREKTGLANLCLAGGVALNCTANGVILRSGLFEHVFVQPAAGDDGTALGAALYVQRQREPDAPRVPMALPLWGPGFDDAALTAALAPIAPERIWRAPDDAALAAEVAKRLAAGQIIAWFQGRMEYGPRALGSRSVLADPRDATMRDRLNRLVKKREEFRPFAPIVKREAATKYFAIAPGEEDTYAHMLFVTDVRPEHRAGLPAVTHVNGSARVQTVSRGASPLLWALLDAFEALTGVPILVNTSFNVRGQPIVCTPKEAVDTFQGTAFDALVMGPNVVSR